MLTNTGYKIVAKNQILNIFEKNFCKLLFTYDIDLVLDVGANVGQYGMKLRKSGYSRRIVSFEPYSKAYTQLVLNIGSDDLWESLNYAIGSCDEKKELHISSDRETGDTNSLLTETAALSELISNASHTENEFIDIHKIDTIFDSIIGQAHNVFLKSDTQGYEKNVFDGAIESLDNIVGIQMELSLVKLYEDEEYFIDMITYLSSYGYKLMGIDPFQVNVSTGQLIEVDAIFFKEGVVPSNLCFEDAKNKLGYPKIY